MKKQIKTTLVGSRMSWAGRVHRMGEDRLSTSPWKVDDGGRIRRGISKLR